MTSTPSGKGRWRAPRWLLIVSYAVAILVPLFGQVIGCVVGIVLMILPHRRLYGLVLVVVSILMALVWVFLASLGAGGGAVGG